MRLVKHAFIAMLISLGVLTAASSPAAGAERITRGDAQAAFQAFWTAGFTIETRTDTTAPGFALMHYTLLNSFHEDVHICTTNWHAYASGWFSLGTYSEALADMRLVEMSFAIDGAPVESNTTAIKRFIAFPDQPAYGKGWGGLIPAGSLSIGAHQLTTQLLYDGTVETYTATFYVDAEGTGSCL